MVSEVRKSHRQSTVTLVATRHEKLGFCNSDALFNIISVLNPDVIFEEIPPSLHDDFYLHKIRRNLESDAIIRYVQFNPTSQIPVDLAVDIDEEIVKNYELIQRKLERLGGRIGFDFRTTIDRIRGNTYDLGFHFLNSTSCEEEHEFLKSTIQTGVEVLNDDALHQAYIQWQEFNDMRENHMIQSIYNYGQEHNFRDAIFTVGAAHRRSLKMKIENFERDSEIHLNWKLYEPMNITS